MQIEVQLNTRMDDLCDVEESMPGYRLLRHPSVVTQELSDGELVLLHVADGQYFTLNETGAHIWQQVINGESPQRAASALAVEYDVDLVEAFVSVIELSYELESRRLLIREKT